MENVRVHVHGVDSHDVHEIERLILATIEQVPRGRQLARLFELAKANLAPYRPRHLRLDVDGVIALADRHVDAITTSEFTQNPWHPESAPHLALE